MASKATKWGIAGAGRISSDFITGVSLLPAEEHQVVAIGSRSLERSTEFAKKIGIPKTYGSYEELATDKDIDVVYMGVIHPSHYPLMKLFLNSGRHVLCEKPLTLNSKHTKEVVELARKKGLFLMEGFWSRFFPVYHDLRKELETKSVGEPKFVSLHQGKKYIDGAEWLTNKSLGAGVLMSLGCYSVMFSQLVFNHEMPENITATAIMNQQDGHDEMVNITLTYSNQRVCNILISKIHQLQNVAYVYGDKGMVKIPNFWSPDEITTPSGTKQHPLPKIDHPTNYSRGQGFMYEAQSVRECLLSGLTENPLMTLDQSIQIQEILDEIKRQIGLSYDGDPE